jgi:RHS repeat-associated protein
VFGPETTTKAAQLPPIAEINPRYYLYDHLGNTRVVWYSDIATGCGATTYYLEYAADYSPYGRLLRSYAQGGAQERYLTTQHERDAETGYDNRGARLYDSEVGRFITGDPLADDFWGWSRYNYVMGNPAILVDPNGMDTIFINRYELDEDLSDEFTNVWRISFTLVSNGVATPLKLADGTSTLYMFGSAINDKDGDNFLNKSAYKLSFAKMPSHPDFENTIRVTDFGVYIHQGNDMTSFQGCKGVCKTYSTTDRHWDSEDGRGPISIFSSGTGELTSQTLREIHNMYNQYEQHLTGDKFILRTNYKEVSPPSIYRPTTSSKFPSMTTETVRKN